jgi:hypothetical protein
VTKELIESAGQFHLRVLSSGKYKFNDELSHEDFLTQLLRQEAQARIERAAAERIKQAGLPCEKEFKHFDTDFQKGISRHQLDILETLERLDSIFNLILIGPPGIGKTHSAPAIGNKAALAGYNVFFSSMDSLVHILKTQEISQKSASVSAGLTNAAFSSLMKRAVCPFPRSARTSFLVLSAAFTLKPLSLSPAAKPSAAGLIFSVTLFPLPLFQTGLLTNVRSFLLSVTVTVLLTENSFSIKSLFVYNLVHFCLPNLVHFLLTVTLFRVYSIDLGPLFY